MKVIEGYFLKYKDVIWAVKGCYHPEGYAVALPRLFNNIKIKTFNLALEIVRQKYSDLIRYVEEIGFEVPLVPLKESLILDPFSVEPQDETLIKFKKIFNNKIGITGSYLYEGKGKDMDFLSFEREHYSILKELREKGITRPIEKIEESEVEILDMSDFKKLKAKRVLEGLFENKEYTFKIVECEEFGKVIDKKDFKGIVKVIDTIKPFSIPVKYLGLDKEGNKYILTSFRTRFTEIPLNTVLYIEGKIFIRQDFPEIDLDIAKTVKLKNL
ncbi:MAG: hypothetical protein QXK68_01810 [Saccharolobus sp.]